MADKRAPAHTQHERFKQLARELGCDEDEAAFEAALRKVATSGPAPKHEPKKAEKPKEAIAELRPCCIAANRAA